ncbi:MAG: hypothetical protein NUV58_05050, partial [Candidatus Roizmanbacteria bacterium]|nr:hypothetical protein [Candidatus Roizmanbacteria bacterium]
FVSPIIFFILLVILTFPSQIFNPFATKALRHKENELRASYRLRVASDAFFFLFSALFVRGAFCMQLET